jgi:hypothetical protein
MIVVTQALSHLGRVLIVFGIVNLFLRRGPWVLVSGGLIGLGGLMLIAGWILSSKPEIHPHLLAEIPGKGYLLGGVLMKGVARTERDRCLVELTFENQFSTAREIAILLKPAQGFFMTRATLEQLLFQVTCPALGVVRMSHPLGVPRELQGRSQPFEIIAVVGTPEGRGTRERFHTGTPVPLNVQALEGARAAAGAVHAVVQGTFGFGGGMPKPATIALMLPQGVQETLNAPVSATSTVVWTPDPRR